jgi:hypothetical protein
VNAQTATPPARRPAAASSTGRRIKIRPENQVPDAAGLGVDSKREYCECDERPHPAEGILILLRRIKVR